MNLDTPVEHLYLVGPTYAKKLTKLGIFTIGDLLFHFPTRYLDYRLISKINLLQPEEIVTIQGTVLEVKNIFTKSGKRIQKGIIADETGQVEVIWYNQVFLTRVIKPGMSINLSGKIGWFGNKVVLESPDYEILGPTTNNRQLKNIHTGRLVPIYPETAGVSSKWLRSRIVTALRLTVTEITDYFPDLFRQTYDLIPLSSALEEIHFPDDKEVLESARKRLSFDELFQIQLFSKYLRSKWEKEEVGNPLVVDQEKVFSFMSSLPFELTNAQKKAIKEILADMGKTKPMNRLLEGDVGSGKTVVAAIAMYVTFFNGYQSILMAPTEILAQQHFQTINTLLSGMGINVKLLTSSTKSKRETKEKVDVIIGTHAILWEKGITKKLGLVIIDEQHRFGVKQRQKLKAKGINPHLLSMTATPIPRTTALTLYGELDLSIIDEMPQGRKVVKTWVVPKEKRDSAYEWIRKQIKETAGQVFIICPLIEESETLISVKSAKTEFEYIKNVIFQDLKVSLIHGRQKTKEKQKVLDLMRDGKINILVATPVVEVGIDIPNAIIMVIEGAERFGLAQLHQLRGRVGRGTKQSYCLLFTETDKEQTLIRLKAMETNFIGARLAQLDLELRGPGEIYGTKQHGRISLKIANLTDTELLNKTKEAANSVLSHLDDFPLLHESLKKGKIEKSVMKGD